MLTPKNNSVAKAFTILRAMASAGREMTATEVAAAVRSNLATVHRFLLSLEEEGAVTRTKGGRFILGQALANLGGQVASDLLIADRIQPQLDALAAEFRETVHFAVISGGQGVDTARALPDRSFAIGVPLGEPFPLYCTAAGKIFLAAMTGAAREAYFANTAIKAFTPATLTDPAAIEAALRAVAAQRHALDDEEWEEGVRSVAVSVRDSKGAVIGAVALSAPTSRLTDARVADVISAMHARIDSLAHAHFNESRVFPTRAKPRGTYPHLKRVDDFIFLSGTSARRPDDSFAGVTLGPDGTPLLDIRKQTNATLTTIREMLDDVGASLNDVIDLQAYLVDIADYEPFNEVYATFFKFDGPTRTTVAVHQLPHPHQALMIRAVAFAPHAGGER